jgi:hypothetical protein
MKKSVLMMLLVLVAAGSVLGQGADGGRPLRELYTDYFPMDVKGWEVDWEGRREQVKSRVMLAAGIRAAGGQCPDSLVWRWEERQRFIHRYHQMHAELIRAILGPEGNASPPETPAD